MKNEYSSQIRTVILAKYCLPILCMVWGAALIDFHDGGIAWQSLMSIPFFLLAFFGASLAVMQVHDGKVRYRRLFKWNTIPSEEILDARVEASPLAGSLRLRRFVAPWGRLYFILDSKSTLNPFGTGEYPMLRYLHEHIISHSRRSEREENSKNNTVVMKLLGVAFLGALFTALCWLVSDNASSSNTMVPEYDKQHLLFTIQWNLLHLLGNVAVVLVISAIFSFLAFYRRNRPGAFILAFLAGAGFSHIALHFLS